MKPKFKIKDAVQCGAQSGIVQEIAPFADHFECLVKFTGGTASWIHEKFLAARETPPEFSPARKTQPPSKG